MSGSVQCGADEVLARLHARFDVIDRRFDEVDKRFDAIGKRFATTRDEINARFDEVLTRLETTLLEAINGSREPIEHRLARCERDIDEHKSRAQ